MNKISVIVTCYNHEKYIETCLRSIFKQSFQNVELIIINDGSTDQSNDIILRTIKESPFEATEYISQENFGSCFARNLGLDMCSGDFVLIVDSDNFLDDNHLEKLLQTLLDTRNDIAYTSLKDPETQVVINEVPEFSLVSFINVNYIDTCSLIRRSVIKNHRFDMNLNRRFMQDYDFFLSLISDGAKPVKVKDIYINYRVLSNSIGNRGENRLSRLEWFDVYSYINSKYPEYASTATNFFLPWYLELNTDYEKVLIELNESTTKNQEMSRNLDKQKEIVLAQTNIINGKDTMIRILEEQKLEILTSTTWKFGRVLTYPLRKMKNLGRKVLSILRIYRESGIKGIKQKNYDKMMMEMYADDSYGQRFILDREKKQRLEEESKQLEFHYQPLISILIPVYNVDVLWLKKCIESIKNQIYSNWEICISDDASTDKKIVRYLKKLEKQNKRIKVVYRTENGHISAATNSALEIANGEFVALLDNDDELAPNALYEVVKALNTNKSLDLIYSDEDKIDAVGKRYDPHFKPDWSPDLILNQNYVSHLGVYRTEIARNIGGFRIGFEGAQDHDFLLRFSEKISDDKIYHIPKVLYHWRAIEGSTALESEEKNYAFDSGVKAIQEALARRKISGQVKPGKYLGVYDIHYDLIEEALVSIIIPTRNGYEDLKTCIDSIIEESTYKNYEIIVADNDSDDPRMATLFAEYKKKLGERFKSVLLDIPFNYSRINNMAVKESKGKYLLFLNNDTKIISTDWIEAMLGLAQFDRIGCVGAKLWYFDDTIQHGGVVLGVGGIAGHSFLNCTKNDPGYFSHLYTNYNYTVVTAACMMVSRTDFDLVSGFDENLAVAFNDVDLCIRIYQLGRNNVWAHNVELYHYESKSRGYEDTPEKQERFKREIDKMQSKYGDFLLSDPAYNVNLSLDIDPFRLVGR